MGHETIDLIWARYDELEPRIDEQLRATDFILENNDLSLEQLSLGVFAARVCAYQPPSEQPRLPAAAARPALYLVPPSSR